MTLFDRLTPRIGLLLWLILATASPAMSGQEEELWVRVHHATDELSRPGLAMRSALSDYGAFQWGRVTRAEYESMRRAGISVTAAVNPFVLSLGGERFDPLELERVSHRFQSYQADPRGDFHLVQFQGPIRGEWLQDLRAAGMEIVQYIHPFTYVVWADSLSLNATRGHTAVRWSGEFRPEFRVVPDQRRWADADEPVILAISNHANPRELAAGIAESGGEVVELIPYTSRLTLLKAVAPGQAFMALGRLPGVYTVQRGMRMQTRGEMSNQSIVGNYGGAPNFTVLPGYEEWLAATGLDGSGVIVSIMDSGVRSTHVDLADRMLPCEPSASPTTCASPSSAHGTHVAGAVAGTGATGTRLNGFLRGQGVAPGARLISQVPPNLTAWWGAACQGADPEQGEFCLTPDGMLRLFREAATNGALLANNSWGSGGFQYGYDIISQQVDVLVRNANPDGSEPAPILPLWSIQNGNGDRNTGSICDPASLGSPEEAKNVFAIGATRLQSTSGTQVSGSQIFSVGQNSAHGPACDGRTNPHIVAPGWRTDSTTSSSNTAHGFAGGTSMASPVVSGAAAIFIQYFRETFDGRTPSPALIKAAFAATAMNMHGQQNADGGAITQTPSRFQGWGRLDLDAVVNPPQSVLYFDQETVFTETGQSWSVPLIADDPDQPIRLMLMWTDAPGPGLAGNTPAWVNLLDLTAETANDLFLGNQIGPDGFSQPGGAPDDRNNMEGVFLRADQHAGEPFTVTVTAAQIVADALDPWNPDMGNPTQDFALVCYNCQSGEGVFSLALNPSQLGVCLPETGSSTHQVDVAVGALGTYEGTVMLTTAGEPAGTSTTLDPESVEVPDTATWILNVGSSAQTGSYSLTLIGDDGDQTREALLALELGRRIAQSPGLLAPANGAVDVSLTPGFEWEAQAEAVGYRLQISADPDFDNPLVDEMVPEPGFVLDTALDTGTEYFWRVAGSNLCGPGEWSPIFNLLTRMEPVAEFSSLAFDLEVPRNGSGSIELVISNAGTGNLVWSVDTDRIAGTRSASGFSGDFELDRWRLINTPAGVDGTVATIPGPPMELFLTGGNAGTGGDTDFQIRVPRDGRILFDWGYQSDDSADFDSAGVVVNQVYTELADNASQVPYFDESHGVELSAGDVFAFRVNTTDGLFGSGILGVRNFAFQPRLCGDERNEVEWLMVWPEGGSVGADDSVSVMISVDPEDLADGEYTAYLCIATNDPNAEVVPIEIVLSVTGELREPMIFRDRFQP